MVRGKKGLPTKYLDANGYLRNHDEIGDTYEHRKVWEETHGPIPDGMVIHHIDGDTTNNTLKNLSLLTPLAHRRIHAGGELRDGAWWKKCPRCDTWKLQADGFYPRQNVHGTPSVYYMQLCKMCSAEAAHRSAKNRRERGALTTPRASKVQIISGEAWRACTRCGEFKNLERDFYALKMGGTPSQCKACFIARAAASQRKRRATRDQQKGAPNA